MDFKTKQTLVYAKGFVASFAENYVDENATDHAQELLNMVDILTRGVTQLLAENDALETKLMLITQAVNTPTI